MLHFHAISGMILVGLPFPASPMPTPVLASIVKTAQNALRARLRRFCLLPIPKPIKIKIAAFNISRRWLA
jgi:hypothetical protein